MRNIVVDVEATGPCPGLYSMISFGAVDVDTLETFGSGMLQPLTGSMFDPGAMRVTGTTREEMETEGFDPVKVMQEFEDWIGSNRARFFSDNNGFDWQFVNYYFHLFSGSNPFGFSSRNIGDLYKGMQRNLRKNFKHLRKTKHTHDPVDDAMGNAEALQAMKKMGLRF